MKVLFSQNADAELARTDSELRRIFINHIEKIASMPPRRHMKYGVPCHVENVTKQARIIYQTEGENLHILHCFPNHKDYERWYNTYK